MAAISLTDLAKAEALKAAKPIFDELGHLALDCIKKIEGVFDDIFAHHHHFHPHRVYDKDKSRYIDLVVDEYAIDTFGNHLVITVLFSPDGKLDDVKHENSGPDGKAARHAIYGCLAVRVAYAYGIVIK